MRTLLRRIRDEDGGVLTFEWILLITVLVIGIVGGLSTVRDGIIDELGDIAGAMLHIDQSYTVAPSACPADSPLGNGFSYQDTVPTCASGEAPGRLRREFTPQETQECPIP